MRGSFWELLKSVAQERVSPLRNGRRVQGFAVVSKPGPPIHHGGGVECCDGVPVRHIGRCQPGVLLPALQDVTCGDEAVLERHLHPQAAEVDAGITHACRLPVDERGAAPLFPQDVAGPHVAVQEDGSDFGLVRPNLRVGLLQERVDGINPRRRSAAQSSTAHGRGRYRRCGCGCCFTAWTLAIAAPAARSRAVERVGGRRLLPGRRVSSVATVPQALPSKSPAISLGVARPCTAASPSARAFVTTMPSVIQRGTETFKTTSVVPLGVPSTVRRNEPEGRWRLLDKLSADVTEAPLIAAAAHRSTRSLGAAASASMC